MPSDDDMDSPMEPLQRLPQSPLTSLTGAQLVLHNDDAVYPGSSTVYPRGGVQHFSKSAMIYTSAISALANGNSLQWYWHLRNANSMWAGGYQPQVLRRLLEKYWGQVGIPGAVVNDWWASHWHWQRRAWTIQESPVLNQYLIAGLSTRRGQLSMGWWYLSTVKASSHRTAG